MRVSDAEIIDVDSALSMQDCMERGLVPIPDSEFKKVRNMDATQRKGWMRNKPCICGSGKKFKRCCWSTYRNRKARV